MFILPDLWLETNKTPVSNKETEVHFRGTTLLVFIMAARTTNNKQRRPCRKPLKHDNGVTGFIYLQRRASTSSLHVQWIYSRVRFPYAAAPAFTKDDSLIQPGSLLAPICKVLSRSSYVAVITDCISPIICNLAKKASLLRRFA
ncbi:hypothetical protein SAMN05428962_5946 [Paenibacillus sp. BC26]|nr:hypothetical protein SAMN05428962_5946 [Paenibacillus sp. BC26]